MSPFNLGRVPGLCQSGDSAYHFGDMGQGISPKYWSLAVHYFGYQRSLKIRKIYIYLILCILLSYTDYGIEFAEVIIISFQLSLILQEK